MWEEGNGAVDDEERPLHGLTVDESYDFLEDNFRALDGQLSTADSIFLRELKVNVSTPLYLLFRCAFWRRFVLNDC